MGDLASSPTLQTLSETHNVYIFTHTQTRAVPSLVPRPSLPPVVELDHAWVQGWYSHETLLLLSCVPDRESENETEGLGMRQRVWE